MKNQILCDGLCPQCKQKGLKSVFELNRMDYWECPNCNLQMQMLDSDYLGILEERGKGSFKSMSYDKERWGARILLRKPLFDGDDCQLKNETELNNYLPTIK